MSNFDPKSPEDWQGLGLVIFMGIAIFAIRQIYSPA